MIFAKYSILEDRINYVALNFVPVATNLLEDFKLPLRDKSMETLLDSKGFVTSEKEHEARVNTVSEFKLVPVSTALDNVLPKIETTVVDGVITNIPVVYKRKTSNLLDGITQQNKILAVKKN